MQDNAGQLILLGLVGAFHAPSYFLARAILYRSPISTGAGTRPKFLTNHPQINSRPKKTIFRNPKNGFGLQKCANSRDK